MRAAIYARVSTLDQEPEHQLRELRRYCDARGWQATAFWTALRMPNGFSPQGGR